jgi:hypothetical protein
MRIRPSLFLHALIWVLVLDVLCLSFPPQAVALIAPALTPSERSLSAREDLSKLQAVLENKIVQQRLKDYGLTPEEINARLAGLSDEDLHGLATNIDGLMMGGHVGVGFLLAFVIVLLVIVVIYLAGYRISVTKSGAPVIAP